MHRVLGKYKAPYHCSAGQMIEHLMLLPCEKPRTLNFWKGEGEINNDEETMSYHSIRQCVSNKHPILWKMYQGNSWHIKYQAVWMHHAIQCWTRLKIIEVSFQGASSVSRCMIGGETCLAFLVPCHMCASFRPVCAESDMTCTAEHACVG